MRREKWSIVGYSFRDDEVTDPFLSAYRRRNKKREKTEVIVIDPDADNIVKNKLKGIKAKAVKEKLEILESKSLKSFGLV